MIFLHFLMQIPWRSWSMEFLLHISPIDFILSICNPHFIRYFEYVTHISSHLFSVATPQPLSATPAAPSRPFGPHGHHVPRLWDRAGEHGALAQSDESAEHRRSDPDRRPALQAGGTDGLMDGWLDGWLVGNIYMGYMGYMFLILI